MRDLLNKLLTGSMVAGAALVVSACGGSESTNTVDNTTVTDMDAMEPVDGATNDVTAIDGANGMGSNMSADANMTMDTNMTAGNMSGNMSSGNMMGNTTTTTTTNTATSNMTNAM